MNFAFPALIILGFSLPGIFCRFAYQKGPTEFKPRLGEVTHEISYGFAIAIFVHLVICPIYLGLSFVLNSVLHFFQIGSIEPLNFRFGFELLAGNNADQHYSDAIHYFYAHFYSISIYALLTICAGYALGHYFHVLIRRCHFDIKMPALRFDDKWYYLFKGVSEYTSKIKSAEFNPDKLNEYLASAPPCMVSALVEMAPTPKIYNGELIDYELNAEGNLDRIVLSTVSRMDLPLKSVDLAQKEKNQADPSLNFVPIEGERFIIPYSKIINLNFKWPFEVHANIPAKHPGKNDIFEVEIDVPNSK